jgi:hypothetical protein
MLSEGNERGVRVAERRPVDESGAHQHYICQADWGLFVAVFRAPAREAEGVS